MPTHQTLPTRWLMTDERLGEALWDAIRRVPRGGGVVLRHHRSDPGFARRVAQACADQGLMLAVAGDVALARTVGATMVHNPEGPASGVLVSRSVHDEREATEAREADLVFVSPIFPTASHPGDEGIGFERGLALAQIAGVPAIALGGIDASRGDDAIRAGFYGFAGIYAWVRGSRLPS